MEAKATTGAEEERVQFVVGRGIRTSRETVE